MTYESVDQLQKMLTKDVFHYAKDSKKAGANKKKNQFTKVQMHIDADFALQKYFSNNIKRIEKWFNVITPATATSSVLKEQLNKLAKKDWNGILDK